MVVSDLPEKLGDGFRDSFMLASCRSFLAWWGRIPTGCLSLAVCFYSRFPPKQWGSVDSLSFPRFVDHSRMAWFSPTQLSGYIVQYVFIISALKHITGVVHTDMTDKMKIFCRFCYGKYWKYILWKLSGIFSQTRYLGALITKEWPHNDQPWTMTGHWVIG